MSNFTTDDLLEAMNNVDNIRNFSIVAQVDAGKSTLADSFLAHAGMINKDNAGDKRGLDTMAVEQERGITIKATGVTILVSDDGKPIVINMIDCPGHISFNAECSAALRITDGALVLIDTVDGVKAQTRTVLTQALAERVRPALVINKIDKLFLSLKLSPEAIYDQFVKNIDDVNAIIETYQDPVVAAQRDQQVNPVLGNVCFATAYHTWGFTLKTFAKMYSKKSGVTVEKMMKKLWDKKTFCDQIIRPLQIALSACELYPEVAQHGKDLKTVCQNLGIELKMSDFELRGKELMRRVMGNWLPVSNAVIEMAADHLPSPRVAQSYRVDLLYRGPASDPYYQAIKECRADGPMIVYISKMVPTKDNSHFYAFGRVFAGTARTGKVKILLNEHNPLDTYKHRSSTYLSDTVQRVVLMMGARIEQVESVPVGCTMSFDGIDKTMVKCGTVVDEGSLECFPLKNMTFSVSPIVRYSVSPKNLSDQGKFSEILKKFVKSDPCLQYYFTRDGEHILAGAGELHLEVALEQLRTDFLKAIEFTVGEPTVPYCETVETRSSIQCLAKSPNKHNRFYCTAEPLPEALVKIMVENELPQDVKERQKLLDDDFNFGDSAKKVWSLAPEHSPQNMLVDCTKGLQFLHEIREPAVSGFLVFADEGPLCGEPLRGVRLNIEDVNMHADAIHRGAGQIMPVIRNVLYSSMLTARPRLLEPVFRVEIQAPRSKIQAIYGVMNRRRGTIGEVKQHESGGMSTIEGFVPVAESFGYVEAVRGETSGTAFVDMSFSHWQIVPGDPLEEGSYANKVMMKIRARKGMKLEMPKVDDFLDKL